MLHLGSPLLRMPVKKRQHPAPVLPLQGPMKKINQEFVNGVGGFQTLPNARGDAGKAVVLPVFDNQHYHITVHLNRNKVVVPH